MVRKFDRTIAFIAGSGLAQGLEGVLEDLEHFENVENEFGEVFSYYVGYNGDTRVVILPRHGDSMDTPARSPAELVEQKGYEANVWLLHELGVDDAYGLSAVGSLEMDIPLASDGVFVVPNTYVRGLAASQHSFGSKAKTVHTPMSESFDDNLRERVMYGIGVAGHDVIADGTYIYNGGDTFETPAEIRTLDKMTGAYARVDSEGKVVDTEIVPAEPNRVVGMTTVPELLLLSQMNIPFAVVCSNVNYAEGLSQETLVSHEQTLDVMGVAAPYLVEIVKGIIESYEML